MTERKRVLHGTVRRVLSCLLMLALLAACCCCTGAESQMYTRRKIKMFAKKSTHSKVLCRIPEGTLVTVLKKGKEWHKVSYDDKTGFVKSNKLTSKLPDAGEEPSKEEPENTPAPENTPEPENTTQPDTSPQPDNTPLPDITPQPDTSPEPEAVPEDVPENAAGADNENADSARATRNVITKLDRSKKKAKDWSGKIVLGEGGLPIPQLFQRDYRQVVCVYNGEKRSVSTSGCGVTCMSMLIAYMTGYTEQNPYTLFREVCQAKKYHGNGLSQKVLAQVAEDYGLVGEWCDLTKEELIEAINAGKPVIAHMGPGLFTEGGHYIVLRGITENGFVMINDPASRFNSRYAFPVRLFLRQARGKKSFYVCEGVDSTKVKTMSEPEQTPTPEPEPTNKPDA